MDGDVEFPAVRILFKDARGMVTVCKLAASRYATTGNVSLRLYDIKDGCPYAMATINPRNPRDPIRSVVLPDDRVMIKDYSENEGMVRALQATNVIGDKADEMYDELDFPVYPLLAPLPTGLITRVAVLRKMEEKAKK